MSLVAGSPFLLESLEARRLLCLDPAGLEEVHPLIAGEDPARDALLLPERDVNTDKESTWTQGTKTVLYIRATFADKPTSDPQTVSNVQSMFTSLNTFWAANSFGTVSMVPTITDLIVLPKTEAEYVTAGEYTLYADARAAAKAVNPAWDYTLFNLDAVRYNGGPGSFSGLAYVGWRGCWLKSSSTGVAAHEFGHNFGLRHANYWSPTDGQTVIGPGSNNEYGDVFDTMGSASAGSLHFNAWGKAKLDWIAPTNVTTVTTDGTYRIHAHDLGGTLNTALPMAVKINKDTRDYWLEFRQASGWSSNPWIMNGVGVRWSPWASSGSGTQLLDTTPGTPAGKNDSAIVIGRTWSDPIEQLHITPLSKDTTVSPPAIDVRVNFGTSANAPTISNLSASTLNAGVGQSIVFSSTATDADGDALAYQWDFGDQTFGNNAASVSKSFSAAGEYRVQLTVSDMRGKIDARSLIVRVGEPATAYRVTGRVVDPDGKPLARVLVHNGLANTHADYRFAYTDSDGTYTLTRLPFGSYAMNATYAGHTITRNGFVNNVAVGGLVSGVDFIATPKLFKISGSVTSDGTNKLPGVIVTASGQSEPVGSAGTYAFFVPIGTYNVSVAKPGYSFSSYSLDVNYGDVTQHFTPLASGVVTGTINQASSGETVTVYVGSRSVTSSNENRPGEYYISGLRPGTYHVTVVGSINSFAPSNGTSPVTVADNGIITLNYAKQSTRSYVLRGRILHRGEPLAGVSVSNGSTSVTSDTDGYYAFTGLSAGSYTITPTMPGVAFSPASSAQTISSSDLLAVNFATAGSNPAPNVAVPASASPATVAGWTALLNALGADDEGEPTLLYTWSAVSVPPGATVSFSGNGTNRAKQTVATFNRAGNYTLRVTIRDLRNATVSSDVSLAVTPQFNAIGISPSLPEVPRDQPRQFVATAYDQFGIALPSQPAFFWTSTGGTIDADGLLTPGPAVGRYLVTAETGGRSVQMPLTILYPDGPGQGVSWDRYLNITGSTVASLTAAPNFPNSPDATGSIGGAGVVLESPTNIADNYGQRWRGYFVAPETDAYRFFIASDDSSELWLSTSGNPAAKSKIASVSGSTSVRQWDKYASQASAPITLERGRGYYLEVLHKAGTGGDHVEIGVSYGNEIYERSMKANRVHLFGTPIANVADSTIVLDEGSPTRLVRVNFSAPIAATTTLSYRVSGTASSGTDFEALNGQLPVSAGATFVDLPVTVLPDAENEPDETLVLTFDSGNGYVVDAGNRTTITLRNAATPLFAAIDPVSPSSRVTPVASITIRFQRPVTGLDLGDLVLARDGGVNLLTGAESLTSSNGQDWLLSGLDPLTSSPGTYQLRLIAGGSGIVDGQGVPLTSDATAAWITYARGDVNGDGVVSNQDIADFVLLLSDPAAWSVQYPHLPVDVGDLNADGVVNNQDIAPFVAALTSSRVAEPQTVRTPTRVPGRFSRNTIRDEVFDGGSIARISLASSTTLR